MKMYFNNFCKKSLTSNKVLSKGSREYLNPNNRIEIQSGDEVYIDGVLTTKIGEVILQSANLTQENGNSNVCQLFIPAKQNNKQNQMLGMVVFNSCIDGTGTAIPKNEPKTIEIRRKGEIICTGKIY